MDKFVKKYMRISLFMSMIGGVAGCSISTPFRWPGFDPKSGVTIPGASKVIVVAITHVIVDSDKRRAFDDHTMRVVNNMSRQPGLIGYSVRKQILGDEAWTVSVWSDEDSLRRFVYTPEHLRAMAAGEPAMKAVRFRRFSMPANELPLNWDRVLRNLEDGKTPPLKIKSNEAKDGNVIN